MNYDVLKDHLVVHLVDVDNHDYTVDIDNLDYVHLDIPLEVRKHFDNHTLVEYQGKDPNHTEVTVCGN